MTGRDAASAAAVWWLRRKLQDRLRTETGRLYGVDMVQDDVWADVTETAVALDAGSCSDVALLDDALDVLHDLRGSAMSEQDLQTWQRKVRYAAQEPQVTLTLLDDAARCLLEDRPVPVLAERVHAAQDVSAAGVRDALAGALDTLLLQSPHPVDARHEIALVPPRPPQTLTPEHVHVPARHRPGGDRLLVGA